MNIIYFLWSKITHREPEIKITVVEPLVQAIASDKLQLGDVICESWVLFVDKKSVERITQSEMWLIDQTIVSESPIYIVGKELPILPLGLGPMSWQIFMDIDFDIVRFKPKL